MIGIFGLVTGTYKVYIDGFLSSLENFRVGQEKEIILLTDEIINTDGYKIPITQHLVVDAPWPIVALLKMWYINKYKKDYSEVYYFDIDTQLKKDLPPCNDFMLCTRHFNHT
jgi:hypothetical protein